MYLIWLFVVLVRTVLGFFFGWLRSRQRYDHWQLERRIDAILDHLRLPDPSPLPAEVARLVRAGRTFSAMRTHARLSSIGLKEAYDEISHKGRLADKLDAVLSHWSVTLNTQLPDEVKVLIDKGLARKAARLLRRGTGMSRADARMAVEICRLPS